MSDRQFHAAKALGKNVTLPEGPELWKLALDAINHGGNGIDSWLTPYGSNRACAAFAAGETSNPWYCDGETLLKAYLGKRQITEQNPAAASLVGT